MNFEELYSHLIGELVESDASLNIYEKGKKCAELEQAAYVIKQELYERLRADEDERLCELLDIMGEIQKETARAVYNYFN